MHIKGDVIIQNREYYGVRGQQDLSQPLSSKIEDQPLLKMYLSTNAHIHPNVLNGLKVVENRIIHLCINYKLGLQTFMKHVVEVLASWIPPFERYEGFAHQ